jgi:hypothetical protein
MMERTKGGTKLPKFILCAFKSSSFNFASDKTIGTLIVEVEVTSFRDLSTCFYPV